jgi:hypothetical protein
MKRSIVFLILISSLLILSNEFFIQSKATTTTNSQKIGLENQWGIGYIVGSGDTVPLIGFNEPDTAAIGTNFFISTPDKSYSYENETVNIYIKDIEDLKFVFDFSYGTNDDKIIPLEGPLLNRYKLFFDFISGSDKLNDIVQDSNRLGSFGFNDPNLEHGLFVNEFKNVVNSSTKQVLFNFSEMLKESEKNKIIFDFKIQIQNSDNKLHTITERRKSVEIKIIIDNQSPEFQNYFTSERIDINNTIFTRQSFSFKVVDKVHDKINQITSLTCKVDNNSCTNIKMPIYPNVLSNFLSESERIILEESGSYEFIARDLAGNQSILNVVVDKIGVEIISFKEKNSNRNIINNEAYSQGIDFYLRDTSSIKKTTISYRFNDVKQTDITLNTTSINLSNLFVNEGKYTILSIEDFLGNKTIFYDDQTSITFYIDKLGPYFEGGAYFISPNEPIKYNSQNVRLKFFDDEFGSGIFTRTYFHIINGVQSQVTLPNQDLLGYHIFSHEGHNLIIVKDKAGNELRLEFFIDKTAPQINGFANMTTIYLNETKTIQFSDNLSGIDFSESTVRFNQQTQPTTLIENFYEIKNEGKYTFYLTDKAGNNIDIVVFLDTKKPTISTQSIENGVEKFFYNEPFNLKYSDSEFGSGIKTYLVFENNEWKVVQKRDIDQFFNNNRISGEYKFQVVDNLNLESDILVIKYDPIKPFLTSDKYIINIGTNYFNIFDMNFAVSDDYSGIKLVNIYEFDFDSSKYLLKVSDSNGIEYLNELVNNNVEGKFKVEIQDNGGNVNSYEIIFDLTPPQLIGYENASYISEWINNINFYFTDQLSGIKKIEFAFEDEEYQPFISFLLFIKQGQYKLRIFDNSENDAIFTLRYDYENPSIEGIVNNSKIKTPTSLYFFDNYSGFHKAQIKLNNAILEENYIQDRYLAELDGFYEVTVFDNSKRATTYNFTIDQTPPYIISSLNIEEYVVEDFSFEYIGNQLVLINEILDLTSSVEKISYFFNDEEQVFDFDKTLVQGIHKFILMDELQNTSTYIYRIDIDETPSLIFNNIESSSNKIYIKNETVFTAFDRISGIYKTYLDEDEVSETFTLDSEGLYNVRLIDNSGLEANYTIVFDSQKPVFDIKIIDNTLKTSEFKIYDELSGIFKLEFRKSNQENWEIFNFDLNNVVYIVENGQYYFRLTDKSQNISEISFYAEIVFTNINFIGNLIKKDDNKYYFNSFVELDFSKIQEKFTVEIKDAVTLEKISIVDGHIKDDGIYLITIINEFENKSNYLVSIDTTPIFIGDYGNAYFNKIFNLDLSNVMQEISTIKVEYCINYNISDCKNISNEYLNQDILTFNLNGVYKLTVFDKFLNETPLEFSIDTTKPSIEIIGEKNVFLNYLENFVDLGVSISDNFDSLNELEIFITGDQVDSSYLGTYVIYYQVRDKSGNFSDIISRNVNVVDMLRPEIQLIGDYSIILEAGTTFIDLGAIFIDNYDGTGQALSIGEVDITKLGLYTIEYSYTDSSGNSSNTVIRTIEVVDTTDPLVKIFNLISNEEVDLSEVDLSEVIYVNYSIKFDITDSGSGLSSVKLNGKTLNSMILTENGTHKLEVTDMADNYISMTIVIDNTKPIIEVTLLNESLYQNNIIFGAASIFCSDQHTTVNCYVNGEKTSNNFTLFVPGNYIIKAIDQLNNPIELEVNIEIPFLKLKSLFWYEFDNIKFREITDILTYIKNDSKFGYQITNEFSYNDLRTRLYIFPKTIPTNLNSVRTFYLLNYPIIDANAGLTFSKLAFQELEELEDYIINQINESRSKKVYSSLNQDTFIFENNYYFYDNLDFNAYENMQVLIRNNDNTIVFEGLYKDSFTFQYDSRYSIELEDTLSMYLFYVERIQEKELTFEIKQDNQKLIKVIEDDNNFLFKNFIEVRIGNYHFDIIVEIIRGGIIESFVVKSNEYFVLSNKEGANYYLENSNYKIIVYYINQKTSLVSKEELLIKLINPIDDLPFKTQRLLSWLKFENLYFYQYEDIINYMKLNDRFEYQVTNQYSFIDLTERGYTILSNVTDKNLKTEFHLIIDSQNVKRAFLTEEELDSFIKENLTKNVDEEIYSFLKNQYKELNVFYDSDSKLFETFFIDVPIKIYDLNNNLKFEGIYQGGFDFKSETYRIEVIDTEKNEPYSFYFSIITDLKYTFQVNDEKNQSRSVFNLNDLTLKSDANVIVSDFPVDVVIEIYLNFKGSLNSKIIVLPHNESIEISREDLIEFTKTNLKSNVFVIVINYYDVNLGEIISKELELTLIDPQLEVKIESKSTKKNIFNFEVNIDNDEEGMFLITEVYLLYCGDDIVKCDNPKRIKQIEMKDNKFEINLTSNDYESGIYKVIVRDSSNNETESIFEKEQPTSARLIKSITGISALVVLLSIIILIVLHMTGKINLITMEWKAIILSVLILIEIIVIFIFFRS